MDGHQGRSKVITLFDILGEQKTILVSVTCVQTRLASFQKGSRDLTFLSLYREI